MKQTLPSLQLAYLTKLVGGKHAGARQPSYYNFERERTQDSGIHANSTYLRNPYKQDFPNELLIRVLSCAPKFRGEFIFNTLKRHFGSNFPSNQLGFCRTKAAVNQLLSYMHYTFESVQNRTLPQFVWSLKQLSTRCVTSH